MFSCCAHVYKTMTRLNLTNKKIRQTCKQIIVEYSTRNIVLKLQWHLARVMYQNATNESHCNTDINTDIYLSHQFKLNTLHPNRWKSPVDCDNAVIYFVLMFSSSQYSCVFIIPSMIHCMCTRGAWPP